MLFNRHPNNPLITPRDVKPSRPDFEVIGVFNAGVTRYKNQVLLLLRVAERPINDNLKWVPYPHMTENGDILTRRIERTNADYDLSDARIIANLKTREALLTSISHFRLARSTDGVHFEVSDHPWITPLPPYENFGIEDARISLIEDTYYVNYSAVSPLGISTGLLATRDFEKIERLGIIFPPSNRDVALFPSRVGGEYICYHRPMPSPFGGLNIWIARSNNLIQWGNHQVVLQASESGWEDGRVGGGAPPILTKHGWLSIYHAADRQHRYCLGFFVTPEDQPEKVILRSTHPILVPEADYETTGFFGNVVFTCGALLDGNTLCIYYGAADESIALAETNIDELLNS